MVDAVRTMQSDVGPVKQSIYELSSTQLHRLGMRATTGDGRAFRYSEAGGVALTPGKLIQGAAPLANHLNRAAAATAAVGATKVQVGFGATAAAANYYVEGFLHCNDNGAEGEIYKVKSHLAISGSDDVWINLYDPLVTAITITTDEVTLTKNPWDSTIIVPNTGYTAGVVGVPIIDVTASSYFWAQTWGPCPVLTQGAVVIGQNVILGGTADGAIGPSTVDVSPNIGWVMQVNASTEYSLIFLTICP